MPDGDFRPMRRIRQQLSDKETEAILENGTTGVLAVNGDGGYPYAVPVNYVYKAGKIYFHGAKAGHDVYRSAVVFGRVRLLAGDELIQAAYDLGMKYYPVPEAVKAEIEKNLPRLACFEITPEHVTGKQAKELL